MVKNAQTTFQNIVTFLFIIVGVIVVGIFASATTPFLVTMASDSNLSGGLGLLVNYWNLLVVIILMFVGLILVFSGGGQ